MTEIYLGVYDALSAKIASDNDPDRTLFLSGYSMAKSKGLEDGQQSFELLERTVNEILNVIPDTTKLIVDIDCGYGNLKRTLKVMNDLLVDAVLLEDQQEDCKCCGHDDRVKVVSTDDAMKRIETACDYFGSNVIAKCCAYHKGITEVMNRLKEYSKLTKYLQVDGISDANHIEKLGILYPERMVHNWLMGGKSPNIDLHSLYEWGYAGVFHSNILIDSVIGELQKLTA